MSYRFWFMASFHNNTPFKKTDIDPIYPAAG